MMNPAELNLYAFREQNDLFASELPRPLPIVVVTGFLGTGKTTLLKQILKARANLRVAVVAHDLASDVNMDASILASDPFLNEKSGVRRTDAATNDGSVVSMAGCACCIEFDENLRIVVKTALNEGVDTGKLDYLVLETSGAADPRHLIGTLEARFGPTTRARLDRVIAVVDAEQAMSQGERWMQELNDNEEKIQYAQLSCADVIVLNKLDLIPSGAPEALEKRILEIFPYVKIVGCSYGQVPIVDVLEVGCETMAGGTVSHEQAPMMYKLISDSVDPGDRPSALAASKSTFEEKVDLPISSICGSSSKNEGAHKIIEWRNDDSENPVFLARLQKFLADDLPKHRKFLRRGKGVFQVHEDPLVPWEWQVSGRLRYACRRDNAGASFGGYGSRSCLVLIFAGGIADRDIRSIRESLDTLTQRPGDLHFVDDPQATTDLQASKDTITRFLLDGKIGFEILDVPDAQGQLVRRREEKK